MSRQVQTVTGPVDVDQLGTTLMHEHFVLGFPGYQGDVTYGGFDKEAFIAELKEFLASMKEFGLTTVVDATPNECGRDAQLLKEIAEQTGLNIICSTGYYYEAGGSPLYFKLRHMDGADVCQEIYDMMRTELYEGIGKTGVRAGVIKLATSRGQMTEYEEWFFRAAARLAVEDPNVRIITHTEGGTCALIQAEYFLSKGVNPRQVSIGHIDGCLDIQELLSVAERGFYMSFDRIGFNGFLGAPLDSRRRAMICALIGSGYGDRILVSHDHVFHDLGRAPKRPAELEAAMAAWNWDYLFRNFFPKLEEMGISKTDLQRLVNENPRAFFVGN